MLRSPAEPRAFGPTRARDVEAIRRSVTVPIIGIQKELQADGQILITPSFEAAEQLVRAGADMIALDCTVRGQRFGAFERLARIKNELRVPVLADIATVDEANAAFHAGADFLLSTMRGYTDDTAHVKVFEPQFIRDLTVATPLPVIAEGRIDSPALAREAIRSGAFCVVVGSSITRPHLVTRLFANSVEEEAASLSARAAFDTATVLAIDMGGTNTKFGLVTSQGMLLWQETMPTPATSGRAALVEHLKRISRTGLERAIELDRQPIALGLATAGWIDPYSGQVVYATENLPEWTGTPIGEILSKETGLPVFVENDANALAVGEHRFGAARHAKNFVCITLGTGVGGGCFIDGQLRRGAHFFANALGHIPIEVNGRACNCGQSGCLETYTNASALLEYAGSEYPSCEALIAAANAGSSNAVQAIQRFAQYLAAGCAVLVQLLDPEALILAGGLIEKNPILLSSLTLELARRISTSDRRNLRIEASTLGYHAGVLGAAALALSS